jgi:hypothetical protein
MGETGDTPLGATGPAHEIRLHLRCNLPSGGQGCGPRSAVLQYRHDEPSPGRNLIGGCAWRSRAAPHGPGRLAPDPKTRASVQYLHRANPFEKPRTQSAGKHLAIHARQLALEPGVRFLRRDCRSLHLRLEPARRSAVEDHVHRPARLGARVKINESWYNPFNAITIAYRTAVKALHHFGLNFLPVNLQVITHPICIAQGVCMAQSMKRRSSLTVVSSALLLCGCSTVPVLSLNKPIEGNNQGKVTRTIDHIACELAKVKEAHPAFARYAAAAQLTIKIENSGGISPSLDFIKPLAKEGTSRTIGIGASYAQGSAKTFTQNFVFITEGLTSSDCRTADDPFAMAGDLGLEEVVVAGLNAVSDDQGGVKWASWSKGDIATASEFGSTITFTTTLAANGGPTLVKKKFEGFGGGDGLLNASHLGTDTLVIAFAPVATFTLPPEKPPAVTQPLKPKSNLLQKQLSGAEDLKKLFRDGPAPPPNPLPPPQITEAERQAIEEAKRQDAESATRRAAVASAKALLQSMILQNINSTP